MISSESSDEELEALHVARAAAPARPKAKKPKRERESAPAVASVASQQPQEPREGGEQPEDDEEARRAKRELRKKRKLEERERRQEEQRRQKEAERLSERAAKGRAYTVSMAVPGSIIDNAQTKELKTYVAGQIARAAVIFQVDEIVVFDDQLGASAGNAANSRGARDCHVFMTRILQYLETPQYLRRALFPMHSDLSCAGLLNPLDTPHHLRGNEWSVYREGVVVDRPLKDKEGSHVNVGLQREVVVNKRLTPGVRVTVKIDEASKDFKKKLVGTLVSSAEPREQLGTYWGYTARMASSLRNVWEDCPFPGGYDLKIGTSERGNVSVDDAGFSLPKFRHALVVFGGVAGIEECVNADETIPKSGEDSHELFDLWVNTCPQQGSRTIRSEEAVLISLAALRQPLSLSGKK